MQFSGCCILWFNHGGYLSKSFFRLLKEIEMTLYDGGADVPLRKKNSSKVFATGKTFPTNYGGNLTIVGQVDKATVRANGKRTYNNFIVQFEDGILVTALSSNIQKGVVHNPCYPRVCGRGFMGQGIWAHNAKENFPKQHSTWVGIFHRCYDEKKLINHPTYRDCEVSKRWWNFQNFCEDIQHLEGYTEWLTSTTPREYHIDKDAKIKGNKVYSKEGCMFLLGSLNTAQAGVTGHNYVAVRLHDGYKKRFTNMTLFSATHDLCRTSLRKAIHSKKNTKPMKGWVYGEEGSEKIVETYKLKHKRTGLFYQQTNNKTWHKHTTLTKKGHIYTRTLPNIEKVIGVACVSTEQVEEYALKIHPKTAPSDVNMLDSQITDWEIVILKETIKF